MVTGCGMLCYFGEGSERREGVYVGAVSGVVDVGEGGRGGFIGVGMMGVKFLHRLLH